MMMEDYFSFKVKNKLGIVEIWGTQGDIKLAFVDSDHDAYRLLCINIHLSYSMNRHHSSSRKKRL